MNKKKLRAIFFEFSATKLGLIITIGFVWLAFKHYSYDPSRNPVWLFDRIAELHQASIDIRLKDRGPRQGSSDVAIVAVDELAVEKLGRWPWPRGRIAQMIDQLVEYGARVIAFDAVFAEPDNNQAVISLQRLKESGQAKGPISDLINAELGKANTDSVMADSVKRNADKVILGSFFNEALPWSPWQELCIAKVETGGHEVQKLEKEDKPLIVLDPNEYQPPEIFGQILDQKFAEITQETENKWKQEKRNPNELENAIYKAKRAYCMRWLSLKEGVGPEGEPIPTDELYPVLKENWPELKASVPEWKDLSWEDAVATFQDGFLHNPIARSGEWVMNLPQITEGSKHNAYFNAFPDKDGTLRRSGLVVRYGNIYLPSLALKSIMVGQNLNPLLNLMVDPIDPTSKAVKSLVLSDADSGDEKKQIPVDGKGQLLINYAGNKYMFPHISVAEIFNGKDTAIIDIRENDMEKKIEVNKKDFFKGKYLIFGATAIGIYDLRVTPFAEIYPGVETHANLVDNMLRDDYLIEKKGEHEVKMVGFIIVLGIILSLALGHMGAVSGLVVTVATLVAIYFVDKKFLFGKGQIVSIVLPILLTGSTYVLMTFYKYLTEERKKKEIKGTFEKYVSPAIVNEVLKDPANIGLGGKKLRMTVIFSDVRGFTTISEKLDPTALVAVLNKYLTPMTALVFKNKGTLDKYMGDAIMAFFGAPIHYPDHAKMACNCALDMMALLPKINEEFKEKGYPPIDIGIGLNTGDMSVGNMGSDTVRSYTVMGDSVNLGSRLEGINKEYGTKIIISEFTYGDVKDDFYCREVDWVKVKGKLLPVRIFELMGKKSEPFKWEELVKHFNEGFTKYHAKDWDGALDSFNKALNLRPDDGPTQLYVERCTEYKAEPPPSDWDGVFTMKTK